MSARPLLTFSVGQELHAIDVAAVREICRHMDITPVDRAPPYIEGLLNLRGQIVTLINIEKKTRIRGESKGTFTHCIVLKAHNVDQSDTVGLLTNHIGDVVHIDESSVEYPTHEHDTATRYLDGIAKWDNQLLLILNPQKITSIEL